MRRPAVAAASRVVVLVACLASLSCTLAAGRRGEALPALARAHPQNVGWRHARTLDLNCDATPDEVFTAEDEHRFYVAVVLGPARPDAQSSVATFLREGASQESLCGPVSSLLPEPLTNDAVEATGEEPPGYRVGSGCFGLRLASGDCDPFHLYWNHTADALDWWRL